MIMSLKDCNYSATELLDAVKVDAPHKFATIGRSLGVLIKLSQEDAIYKGDCDGLDALCYHLDGYTVQQSIEALQKVLQRFKEID